MNWEIKYLHQISENLDNKRIPITKHIRSNGAIPYYGASGIVDYVEKYIFDEDLLLVSEDGANLLARTYPIAFSISGKTWVNNHAHVLRFKDKISQRFVELYLNSIQLNDYVSGMAQPKLNQTMLNTIPIPFPPLSEQKRIVAILDKTIEKISQAKENAEKNINHTREIFESYLQSVFETKGEGWEEKTLGEVCEIINGGTPDTTIKEYWDGQNLWITPKDMGKLESIFVDETIRKITDSGLKNCSAKLLPINSIILSSRAPIGHLAINTKPMSTNQGCKGIVPKKNLNFLFVYHFLKKSVDLLNSLGSGTTFKELSGSKLAEVLIPFPPLKEQQSIVKKLDKLSRETKKLESVYEKKLADLEELKKSILQKAFKGELTGVTA